jgi:hypothetical protein
MKKIILILSLFCVALQAQTFQWAKREGLWAYDYGYGITTDNEGNVYVAGKYEKNAKFSGVTLPCQGNHDIYLAKYSPSGSLIWIRTAGGYSGDYAWNVACDGNYVYIAGEIQGTNALIKFIGSPITLTCKGSNDIFVAKYDLNGNLIWAKRAGDFDYDKALGVTYDASGNVYISGIFTTKAVFGGTTTIYSSGDKDIFVAKYDSNGNFLWVRKAGGTGRDEAKSIRCDAAGNVYTCGMFKNTATFGTQMVTAPNGHWDMFLAKYSTTGTLLWLKTAGANWDDVAWSVTMDNTGKIYVAGEFNSTVNFGGIPLSTKGSSDIFVACYNSSGSVLWAKRAGGTQTDRARGIGCDGSNIYITGQFGGAASFGPYRKTAVDNSDIFMACLDNSGQFTWAAAVGGPADLEEDLGYESGIAICSEASGNVYATGALLNGGVFGNIALSPYTRTDVFVTKIRAGASKKGDNDSVGIKLLSFNGEVKEKNVILSWALADESKENIFTIERSKDGNFFEPIGTVNNLSDPAALDYSFIDDSLYNVMKSEIYYRLKQTNKDGTSSYSETIALVINKWGDLPIKVYPNPAKDALMVSIDSEFKDQQFSIYFSDLVGHEISRAQINGDGSQIDISSLSSGIYFVEIKAEDEVLYKEKLVIQK